MSEVVAAASLREFFKGLLDEAMARQRTRVGEWTEFYLVNLLAEFVASDRLFSEEEEGKKDHEPLAFLYHRALRQGREEQIKTLRRLGDVSLYKVGFFKDALRESVVGTDYYMQMGGAAYGQVATLSSPSSFANVYQELCDKFRAVADLLEEISARGLAAAGPAGTLKVYESWVRTGDERLRQVLVDAGLTVNKPGLPN